MVVSHRGVEYDGSIRASDFLRDVNSSLGIVLRSIRGTASCRAAFRSNTMTKVTLMLSQRGSSQRSNDGRAFDFVRHGTSGRGQCLGDGGLHELVLQSSCSRISLSDRDGLVAWYSRSGEIQRMSG